MNAPRPVFPALLAAALLLLLAALPGCASDDQSFDLSALSPGHRLLFIEAMDDLNSRYDSQFTEDPDGISTAGYAPLMPPNAGRTLTMKVPFADRIIFAHKILLDPILLTTPDPLVVMVMTHELCHVLDFGHGASNPQGGSC